MALAVVRSIEFPRRLRMAEELEDFEQELVDQYALAGAAAGITDSHIAHERSVLFEFSRFLARPLWTAVAGDADRYLTHLRRERKQAHSTLAGKAGTLAMFYDFLISRYQGDIHALTGYVVVQPIDEFNRPERDRLSVARVPPSESEVGVLFDGWRDALASERKFLPTARDYFAASLWRRLGLRISETCHLDLRDWHPELGEHGRLHVRFGKGSSGRGYKARLVPAIDGVDELMVWWLTYVRHQFDDRWQDPDAPLLPSERRDRETGRCARVGPDALRSGLAAAVDRYLAAWSGRCTPHTLRHYCASALYARGIDLKAIQELLGHTWLSTTTWYIHVHEDHVERAWAAANERTAARLGVAGG